MCFCHDTLGATWWLFQKFPCPPRRRVQHNGLCCPHSCKKAWQAAMPPKYVVNPSWCWGLCVRNSLSAICYLLTATKRAIGLKPWRKSAYYLQRLLLNEAPWWLFRDNFRHWKWIFLLLTLLCRLQQKRGEILSVFLCFLYRSFNDLCWTGAKQVIGTQADQQGGCLGSETSRLPVRVH